MIIIVLLSLSLISFNLFGAELSPLHMARVDDRVREVHNRVLKAEYRRIRAQLEKCSENTIKKYKAAVTDAAQEMLFVLATSKEQELRLADIDFCLERAQLFDEALVVATSFGGITLVRELIKKGADVNADNGAALRVAIVEQRYSIKNVLCEAGAAI